VHFRILGEITDGETIATGSGIRELARLRRRHGRARWRKRKGTARVELAGGSFVWPRSIGTRRVARGSTNSRSSVILTDMATRSRQLVLCLRNRGYEVSLERRKLYQVIPDREAAKHGQLRVIDESGEDYLYPASFFAVVKLPPTIRRRVLAAA
jgi:hypothetical protein